MRGTIEHVAERMSTQARERALWETMVDARQSGAWLSVRELAERAGCKESAASRFLTASERTGNVQRIIRPGFDRQPDQRVYRLSPAGRAAAAFLLR